MAAARRFDADAELPDREDEERELVDFARVDPDRDEEDRELVDFALVDFALVDFARVDFALVDFARVDFALPDFALLDFEPPEREDALLRLREELDPLDFLDPPLDLPLLRRSAIWFPLVSREKLWRDSFPQRRTISPWSL